MAESLIKQITVDGRIEMWQQLKPGGLDIHLGDGALELIRRADETAIAAVDRAMEPDEQAKVLIACLQALAAVMVPIRAAAIERRDARVN